MVASCTLDQRLDKGVVVLTWRMCGGAIPIAKRSRLVASFAQLDHLRGQMVYGRIKSLPFSVRFAVAVAVMSGIVACRQFIPPLIGQ